MKMKLKYQLLVGIFAIFLMGIGVYIGFNSVSNKGSSNNNSNNNENVNIEEESNSADTVVTKKYDIELTYIDHYSLCGENIENTKTVYGTTIDELKEIEKKYQDGNDLVYEIKEQSKEKLVYYRELEKNCPNHFIAKIENDVVVIYNNVSDEVTTEYRKLEEVAVALIREDLKKELENGIKIDSVKALELLIEDLES